MNDNHNHIGSNWGGGTPRTMDEAFPRRGRADWDEPSLTEKITSTVMATVFVGFLYCVATIGAAVF